MTVDPTGAGSSSRFVRCWPGNDVLILVTWADGMTGVAFAVRDPDGALTYPDAQQSDAGWYCIVPKASVPGDWSVRATCDAPAHGAVEGQFQIAQSLVGADGTPAPTASTAFTLLGGDTLTPLSGDTLAFLGA